MWKSHNKITKAKIKTLHIYHFLFDILTNVTYPQKTYGVIFKYWVVS